MSSSDTIENSEEKEKILSNQIFQYAYPSNPKEIIKAFRSLKKPQIIKLSISCIIIILFGIFNNIQIISIPFQKIIVTWMSFMTGLNL